MRIGIDGTSWFNARGYGRYTRELLPELVAAGAEHEFLVFAEKQNAGRLDLAGENVRIVPVDCGRPPTEAASADGYRSPRDMLRFTSAVRRERPDVTFFPTVYTFFPMPPGCRAVVAIHDAITERFPELTLPNLRARLFWRMKVRLAISQSRLVLTVSEYAKRDITKHLGVPAERLRVTSEAPSEVYRPATADELPRAWEIAGLPAGTRWFTYVGGFNPHKRLDVLVKAHARLAGELEDPPHLLLVGSSDSDVFHECRSGIVALTDELGTGHLVHWTGFVADEDLRLLHAAAIAGVLPSEAEGFGLPAVETAACGSPVIATTQSPLPEVLEGGGVFLDPGDPETLADAMRLLATDAAEHARCAAAALERASSLSWPRAGRIALETLEEAAA